VYRYPRGISKIIKTRLSNSYLIGEIFGMLFFGVTIDRLGRRTGIVFATLFLILGIVLATAAHGKDQLGLFWMMIVARIWRWWRVPYLWYKRGGGFR